MPDYSDVQRSRRIAAEPQELLPLLSDFHRWPEWSPWEGIDPEMQRSYGEIESGVGAWYEWSGNRKAGAGRMQITEVAPERVTIDLQFTRPFKSSSIVLFDLSSDGEGGTQLDWTMRSPKTLMLRIVGLFMNLDKSVGKDLDQGLDNLQRVAGR